MSKEKFIPPFDAIKVAYYRGIGSEQIIGPLDRMNVFIGPNNAGKSIILNLLHDYTISSLKEEVELKSEEKYRGKDGRLEGNFSCAFKVKINDSLKELFEKKLEEILQDNIYELKPYIEHYNPFSHCFNSFDADIISSTGYKSIIEVFLKKLDPYIWQEVLEDNEFISNTGTFLKTSFATSILVEFLYQRPDRDNHEDTFLTAWFKKVSVDFKKAINFQSIKLISAIRDILLSGDEESISLNGEGFIKDLKPYVHATYDSPEKKEQYVKINKFLKQVLQKENVRLIVPHNDSIEVEIDGKTRPLDTLGTGIKELVIIAAYCTIYDGDIICIEEPEIHLHPALQRKLMRYLLEETSSQYFIATHSNIFIDMKEANLFQVTNDGEETHIKSLLVADEAQEVLDDLGYLASDLLQSNYIIWVEGPSDRLYLRHWISLIDPNLQENMDYIIMFYGGALVKYLSVSDGEAEIEDEKEFNDFIKLLKINRKMTIVMDRDCPHYKDPHKPAVKRIEAELLDTSEALWVTFGREIENYVLKEKLQEKMREIHSKSDINFPSNINQLDDHLFKYFTKGDVKGEKVDVEKSADKVKLASKICDSQSGWEDFYLESDLEEKVKTLVQAIKKANGLSEKEEDEEGLKNISE